MWSKADAPLEQQAHLLALGSPELKSSGFGHEGTGVKPRGWSPLEKIKPKEVVQCLRVKRGEKYNTYYGYFIDPKTGDNTVKLQGLNPNTKHYYRTIVHNDQGTMWEFESQSFTTKP